MLAFSTFRLYVLLVNGNRMARQVKLSKSRSAVLVCTATSVRIDLTSFDWIPDRCPSSTKLSQQCEPDDTKVRLQLPIPHPSTTVKPDMPKNKKSMATPTSIFSRKRDLAYLVFFLIHIPVLLCKNHPLMPSLSLTLSISSKHPPKLDLRPIDQSW